MIKALVFDMYGVLLKESKGNFIPYVLGHFPTMTRARIVEDFTKAGLGGISGDELLKRMGFADSNAAMRDYIDHYLTADEGFAVFRQRWQGKVEFALLSNDVAAWSRYICQRHGFDEVFTLKIVSGEVGCRKPDPAIFALALEKLPCPPEQCLFIDNSEKNVLAAQAAGMRAVLFDRDNEPWSGDKVNDFGELSAYVAANLEKE